MATANPIAPTPIKPPDFHYQIQLARQEIKAEFQKLVGAVGEREILLLDQLDELEKKLEEETKSQNEVTEKLEANRKHCLEDLDNEMLRELKESILAEIEKKLSEVKENLAKINVGFYRSEDMYETVDKFGSIFTFEMDPVSLADYRKRVDPVFRACSTGDEDGEMAILNRIAIENKTDRIYVSSWQHNCVQVFNSEGEYLFKFGDTSEVQMKKPSCIAISEDKVYVGQNYINCVLVYLLNGNYITKFGEKGKGDGEMRGPIGLAVNAVKEIYVCDYSNCRMIVFDGDHKFKSTFTCDDLALPIDVKITTNHNIIVLAKCADIVAFFRFNKDDEFIEVIDITVKVTFNCLNCFCLDSQDNILLCDRENDTIHCLSSEGKPFHQIGSRDSEIFDAPNAIAIDSKNRIVVIDSKNENCLQYF